MCSNVPWFIFIMKRPSQKSDFRFIIQQFLVHQYRFLFNLNTVWITSFRYYYICTIPIQYMDSEFWTSSSNIFLGADCTYKNEKEKKVTTFNISSQIVDLQSDCWRNHSIADFPWCLSASLGSSVPSRISDWRSCVSLSSNRCYALEASHRLSPEMLSPIIRNLNFHWE